jgi:hypothetical protein
MGELSLHMAVDWLCGVRLNDRHERGQAWEEARQNVGEVMRKAQAVVGRRMKIGNLWVSTHASFRRESTS